MFVDYYEILEVDSAAQAHTIESKFFEIGQQIHPDVPVTGDKEKFEKLAEAFQVLRIPESRQEYDELYIQHQSCASDGDIEIEGSNADASMENLDLEKEFQDRVHLMQKFYERRRVNQKNPGLAAGSLDGVVNCSQTMVDFHLWYCLQKGWLLREESGQLAITPDGVDFVESGLRKSEG